MNNNTNVNMSALPVLFLIGTAAGLLIGATMESLWPSIDNETVAAVMFGAAVMFVAIAAALLIGLARDEKR